MHRGMPFCLWDSCGEPRRSPDLWDFCGASGRPAHSLQLIEHRRTMIAAASGRGGGGPAALSMIMTTPPAHTCF